jgi:predicted  nucleic acid-binding Zn-ribbon protein
MSNRVEELESRVKELEATVRGLTEELVEANERIRALESELEDEADVEPEEIGVESHTPEQEEPKEEVASTDDIIVA